MNMPVRHLSAFVFLASLVFTLAAAPFQQAPSLSVNEAIVTFGESIAFKMTAPDGQSIQKATLIYGTSGRSCQAGGARQAVELTRSGSEVSGAWELEWKRIGVVPPGASLWWQWEFEDTVGTKTTTPRTEMIVQDSRHDWQSVSGDGVTLFWYLGDQAFGQFLHDLALESLAYLEQTLGLRPSGEVYITIYNTSSELAEISIGAPEWIGGFALPDYNAAIFSVAPGENDWARDVMPHELAHLVVDSLVFNCYGAFLPTWMNEGLAVVSEGEISESDRQAVSAGLEADELKRLVEMERGFSAYGNAARLAYAQSGLAVEFMILEYGQDKLLALLNSVQQGNSFKTSLEQVYEKNTDQIDAAWRESLGFELVIASTNGETTATPTPVPTVALFNPLAQVTPATATPTPLPVEPTAPPAPTEGVVPPTKAPTLAPSLTPMVTPTSQTAPTQIPRTLIVGGGLVILAFGGLAALTIIFGAIFLWRRRS